MDISVSIVEDNGALRETLVRYVNTRGFRCVSAYGSAEDVLCDPPRVVLMNINLPRKNGIECVAELKTPGATAGRPANGLDRDNRVKQRIFPNATAARHR